MMQPLENSLARLPGIKFADTTELSKPKDCNRADRAQRQHRATRSAHKAVHCILVMLTECHSAPSLENQGSQYCGRQTRKYSVTVGRNEPDLFAPGWPDLKNNVE